MRTVELRREIKKAVDRLPPEWLDSLADYVYCLNRPPLARQLVEAEKAIAAGVTRVFGTYATRTRQ